MDVTVPITVYDPLTKPVLIHPVHSDYIRRLMCSGNLYGEFYDKATFELRSLSEKTMIHLGNVQYRIVGFTSRTFAPTTDTDKFTMCDVTMDIEWLEDSPCMKLYREFPGLFIFRPRVVYCVPHPERSTLITVDMVFTDKPSEYIL